MVCIRKHLKREGDTVYHYLNYDDTKENLHISAKGVNSTTLLGKGRYRFCISGNVLSEILDGSTAALTVIPIPAALGARALIALIVWAVRRYAFPRTSGICLEIQLHWLSAPTLNRIWLQ